MFLILTLLRCNNKYTYVRQILRLLDMQSKIVDSSRWLSCGSEKTVENKPHAKAAELAILFRCCQLLFSRHSIFTR